MATKKPYDVGQAVALTSGEHGTVIAVDSRKKTAWVKIIQSERITLRRLVPFSQMTAVASP